MAARWRFLPCRPFPQRHLQPAPCTRPAGWNVGVCWLSASLSCLGPVGNNSMGQLVCYAHSLNGKPLNFPQSHHKQRHVKVGLWKAFRLKTGKCGTPIPPRYPKKENDTQTPFPSKFIYFGDQGYKNIQQKDEITIYFYNFWAELDLQCLMI